MDIVIPYIHSPANELKYALRSIEMYQSGDVLLIGDKPDWYKGDHIPHPNRAGTKQICVRDKILAANLDTFILWYDDVYQLRPGFVTNTYLCTLKEAEKKAIAEVTRLGIRNVMNIYSEGLYYGNHRPIIINGEKFKESMQVDWRKNYNVKSLYCNYVGGGVYAEDCKARDEKKMMVMIETSKYLSTHNISKEGLKLLDQVFPNKSKYEV